MLANDDPALHSPWTAGPGVRFVDMAAGELPDGPASSWSPIRPTMRRIGRRRATTSSQESFSWDAHLDLLEAVYRDVLG